MLSDRGNSVMTGTTCSKNMCVVDSDYRLESEGAVTVFADIACLYVCCALAHSGAAVMARHAVSYNPRVIKPCWQPARRAVAVIALIIARNMAGSFSHRLRAIVAIDTATGQ